MRSGKESTRPAGACGDGFALGLEGVDPVGEARRRIPFRKARHIEQIANLRATELIQQIGEELPSLLADAR